MAAAQKPKKLVVGASAGGHLNELLILLDAATGSWPARPACFVTTLEIAKATLTQRCPNVHVLGEADRSKPLRALGVVWRSFTVALAERPDVVVTTGSMPLAIFCLWCKLLGARIVWIDSVAQVDQMSMSGRFVRLFADLCLVQWPDVAKRYARVEYAGELL